MIIEDVENSFIKSDNRLIVVGIENLIVVDTNDATLIIDINQTIKLKILEKLNKNKIAEGKQYKKVYRPWGHFIQLKGLTGKLKE